MSRTVPVTPDKKAEYAVNESHRLTGIAATGCGVYNRFVQIPTLIFHADWGSKPSKRWYAKANFNNGATC